MTRIKPVGSYFGDGGIKDYARPYFFKLELPILDEANKKISALCRSTKLPEYTIQTAEIPYAGLKLRVATVPAFADSWVCTIMDDENYSIRGAMLKAMEKVYKLDDLAGKAINEYKATTNYELSQLDRTGSSIHTYKLFGAFPKAVGEISLSHSELDPITFDLTFSLDYFIITPIKGKSPVTAPTGNS